MRFSSCLGLLAAVLAACSSSERTSSAGDAGGTIVDAVPSDAANLLPVLVGDATGREVSDQIFDRLAEISQTLTTGPGDKGFTPRLAQRWTWSPDSLSIAF